MTQRMILPVLAVSMALFFGLAKVGSCAALSSDAPNAQPLPVGHVFPDLELKGESDLAALAEKGLAPAGKSSLRLQELKAEAVITLVFSMYCPYCQREAPLLNEINEKLAAKGLGSRVFLLGIGAGNSAFEVDVFRKKFKLNFPMFSDPDFAMHKQIGQVGTPYHYVLKREANGEFRVVDGLLGCIESVDGFLAEILKKLGLEGK